jgi:hypothetical protein
MQYVIAAPLILGAAGCFTIAALVVFAVVYDFATNSPPETDFRTCAKIFVAGNTLAFLFAWCASTVLA